VNAFIKHNESNIAEPKETQVKPEVAKKRLKFWSFLNGSFLERDEMVGALPYIFFLVFLGLVYIANGYLAESTIRQIDAASKDLKEMRSEYVTRQSDLMHVTKQSELSVILEQREMGLKESLEPPKKIVVKDKEFERMSLE